MPYRLPDEVWRGLLARAVLLEARAPLLGRFSDLVESGSLALRSALDGLQLSATRAAGAAGSDGEAIGASEEHWQGRLEECLQARPELEERELLEDLQGRPADPDAKDPFRTTCQGILERSATLYGSAWPARTPALQLLPLDGHPRAGGDPYALSAQTLGPPSRQAIELQIQPDGLGPATFLALPVVLVHECVCHVVPIAMGQAMNNNSPFAEGFMDWAASYHLRRWLPRLCVDMAPDVFEHEERLATYAMPRGHRSHSPRYLGRSAARTLVSQLVNRFDFELDAAENRVASLALNMNLSRASGNAKDVVIQEIDLEDLTVDDASLGKVILDERSVDELF